MISIIIILLVNYKDMFRATVLLGRNVSRGSSWQKGVAPKRFNSQIKNK